MQDLADDLSIPDDWRMLRRIPPAWIKDFQPESSNFSVRQPNEGLSVTAWCDPSDLIAVQADAPSFGVVRVLAGELREAGFRIVRLPEPGNPNHCECYGNVSRAARRRLASAAVWVVPPAEHDPVPYGALESF